MTNRFPPHTLTDRRDLAAYWHARLQSDDVTEDERKAFQQWCDADPRNARQYRQVLELWQAADRLPAEAVNRLGRRQVPAAEATARKTQTASPPARPPRDEPRRRRALQWGLGLACTAGLAWGLASLGILQEAPVYQTSYATAHGEQRQQQLPDGSTLALNTDTELTVSFYDDHRIVRLARGEVFLQVRHSDKQPFLVDVDTGQVRVTGTQFNVRRDAAAFSVGVLEGAVQVRTGNWWNRQRAELRAGDLSRSDGPGAMSVRRGADVDSLLAWREGKVVFRGTPLADAVRELNRYADRRLVLSSGRAGQLRVSGIFDTHDLPAFLTALPDIVPVAVDDTGQGTIAIRLREGR